MLYSIQWDNEERTVVLQQYLPGATKDDWYEMARQSAQMLRTVPHKVHLIIDERNVDLVATSTDMHYLEKNVPPNEGVCVMVVPRSEFIYRTVKKRIRDRMFPNSHHEAYFVETVEDARKLLRDRFGVVYAQVMPVDKTDS